MFPLPRTPCPLQKIFVANPNKPQEVKIILARNHKKLLELLHNLSSSKGILRTNSILLYRHYTLN
ncbi:unnamed protein product [Brassica oleracea]